MTESGGTTKVKVFCDLNKFKENFYSRLLHWYFELRPTSQYMPLAYEQNGSGSHSNDGRVEYSKLARNEICQWLFNV